MSFTVCIEKTDENQFRVYVDGAESADDSAGPIADPAQAGAAPAQSGGNPMASSPAAPDDGTGTGESVDGQVVQTIKEALTLAMEALKGDGSIPDHAGQAKAFQAGFSSGAA